MPDSPCPTDAASKPVRFRLLHLVYAMALLGSCLALFGSQGVLLALVVLLFWRYVFGRPSRPRAFSKAAVVVLVSSCLIGLLLPEPHRPRESLRRVVCSDNLSRIALALRNYHETYGEFPSAHVVDSVGKPMHSWRVLLLPFLGAKDVYDKYCFDKPWDGPNNRRWQDKFRPEVYRCPSASFTTVQADRESTSYVTVVGPETIWDDANLRRSSKSPQGNAATVTVVEYEAGQIGWMDGTSRS